MQPVGGAKKSSNRQSRGLRKPGGKALGWPTSITEHRRRAEEAVVVDLLDEEICDISAGYEA